jgi:hypothetical protein
MELVVAGFCGVPIARYVVAILSALVATPTFAGDARAAVFDGLWVQEDSGGVLQFLPDGKIVGWPVGGRYKFGENDWIEIRSERESLECRWKKKSDDVIELRRFVEGREDVTQLDRLKAVPLDLKAWQGRYFIWHLTASGKRATGRALLLDEKGYFRTKEGGFYLRLFEGKNGAILAYASGEEDATLTVRVFKGGRYLVIFDRLQNPQLFASCMRAASANR